MKQYHLTTLRFISPVGKKPYFKRTSSENKRSEKKEHKNGWDLDLIKDKL